MATNETQFPIDLSQVDWIRRSQSFKVNQRVHLFLERGYDDETNARVGELISRVEIVRKLRVDAFWVSFKPDTPAIAQQYRYFFSSLNQCLAHPNDLLTDTELRH